MYDVRSVYYVCIHVELLYSWRSMKMTYVYLQPGLHYHICIACGLLLAILDLSSS